MHWLYLAIAVIFEIGFVLGTNAAKGFTRLWWSVFAITSAVIGVYFLSLALRVLDVGVGYTIWTGLGTIGTVVAGVLFFKERLSPAKAACFAAIVLGVIGLRVAANV